MDPDGAAGSSCQTAAGPPSGGHACGRRQTARLRGAACWSCWSGQLTAALAMGWWDWTIFRPAIADFPKSIILLRAIYHICECFVMFHGVY